jgi:hypothetical protein
MRARDQKASSGAPQQATAGIFVTRTLNTSAYNNIPGASLASNQISVGAGTYDVFLRAPAVGGKHQATLWNVTTGAHAILGSSAGNNATADDTSTDSIVMGRVVPSGPTVYEVRHWHQVTGKYLGVATNSGAGEVYTEVIFTKVA